jgi:23S rRNA (uracil1939-C5)-methyltransferase
VAYVSCGLDSFLRDAAELCAHGYRFESLAVHDMFPHSGHVETLAHFVR